MKNTLKTTTVMMVVAITILSCNNQNQEKCIQIQRN